MVKPVGSNQPFAQMSENAHYIVAGDKRGKEGRLDSQDSKVVEAIQDKATLGWWGRTKAKTLEVTANVTGSETIKKIHTGSVLNSAAAKMNQNREI